MAEHKVRYATATGNDYAEHEATYHNVLKLAKVGVFGAAGIIVAVGIWGTVGSVFWTSFGVIAAMVAIIHGLMADSVKFGAFLLVLLLIVWALLV